MPRPTKFITTTLSIRISLLVVFAIATLLTAALFIMFRYTRQAVRQEALQKASQTLEATVQNIDNILLNVEQSAGNIYWDLITHPLQPDSMFKYIQLLVETNPHIAGCAIAMKPDFFKERGRLFMAYVHRRAADGTSASDAPLVWSETFGSTPYTEQVWYTQPMTTGKPCWINPLKNEMTEGEAIISFGLPIYTMQGQVVGVLGVDVSLKLLSDVVLAAKPSPNSYATLLGSDGAYIIHPDSNKLFHQNALTVANQQHNAEMKEAITAMMDGEAGYRLFNRNGVDNYVFYKPFKRTAIQGRSSEDLGWSIGIIYPEDDIFGDYNHLLHVVVTIALAGLLLLLLCCWVITHRQLLPLKLLTQSVQRIADGHYDEPVPDSRQHDEVGRLQNHFQQMQRALSTRMGELERLTTALHHQSEELATAYEQAKEANAMKTAFLHHMTNQMTAPVSAINRSVTMLHHHYQEMEQHEVDHLAVDIQQQGQTVTELLDDLLETAGKAKGFFGEK